MQLYKIVFVLYKTSKFLKELNYISPLEVNNSSTKISLIQ